MQDTPVAAVIPTYPRKPLVLPQNIIFRLAKLVAYTTA